MPTKSTRIPPSRTFNKFFVNGQLRVATLSPEEKVLLDKFSELTGMKITDMGELDLAKAEQVASEIETLVNSEEFRTPEPAQAEKSETKWVCSVCKYVHTGDAPPEKCPPVRRPGRAF